MEKPMIEKNNSKEYFVSKMPHFIAINYQRLQDEQSPQKQIEIGLHIYNLGLRILTLVLVSQYLIQDRDKVSDSYLNQLLQQKFPHLTLDAWQQLFFSTLKAYEGKRDLLFIPELYDFYWDISTWPHKCRIDVELPYQRLTQISIEIKIRKFLPQNEVEWKRLAEEVSNLLDEWVKGLAFIGNYDLIRVIDFNEDSYYFELHKGLQISKNQCSLPQYVEFNRGWFYLRSSENSFLLLHPLVVFWEIEPESGEDLEADIGIYDRFIYEKLQYLLAFLGKTVFDHTSVKAFLKLLFDTIEEIKLQRQKSENLTWWQLRDICENITYERMATIRHKYQSALYLQRNHIRQEFEKFLKSDAHCFVLIGKSGVGKSNFLLALAEELQRNYTNLCLLMYDGANLKIEPSITEFITQDFNDRLILGGKNLEHIWYEIAKIEKIEERLVILFVDAINENSQAKELLRQLDELVQKPWNWLKIGLSSRPETWQSIKHGLKLANANYYREKDSDSLGVMLEPFSYSEKMEPFSHQELPDAYAKYQQIFKLYTSYDALRSEVRELLREPLNLWLVAKTYGNAVIPETLKVIELVEGYINHLLESKRLKDQDRRFLEKRLVPLMVREGHYTNALTIADIDAGSDELYDLIYSEQILSDGQRVNQSFTNLIDADILVRQGEGREQTIAFKYERLYEYFVGRRLFELSDTYEDRQVFFLEMINKISEVPFLWGAVKYALVQEIRDYKYKTIFKLCFIDEQRVKELLVNVLMEYSELDRDSVSTFLEQLIATRRIKENKTENNAKRIAMEVATRLDLLNILEIAAGDPSPTIRSVASRQIYYLWHRNQEQGFQILKSLVKRVHTRWKLPNTRIIETYIGASVLIFLQHKEDEEVVETLRLLGKEVIKKLLYIDKKGGMELVKSLIRKRILRVMIQFAVRFAQYDRHNPVNPKEFEEFFKLSIEERKILRKLLPYLNAARTDIETIKDEILTIAQTGELFISYVMYSVLIVQGTVNWQKVKPLLLKIFDLSMNNTIQDYIPHIMVPQILNVPAGIAMTQNEYDEDVITTFQDMTKKFYDKSKGRFYCKYGIYFGAYLCVSAFLSQKSNNIEDNLLIQCCMRALEEKDEQYLLDIIWDLGNLALGFEQPQLALQTARFLLPIDIISVRSALMHFLARVRLHYPDHVDNFLAENDVLNEVLERIKGIEVSDEFSTLIQIPWTRFFAAAPFSPKWRNHEIEIYDNAIECKNIIQWLEFFAKKIVNAVYDEPIFRI